MPYTQLFYTTIGMYRFCLKYEAIFIFLKQKKCTEINNFLDYEFTLKVFLHANFFIISK